VLRPVHSGAPGGKESEGKGREGGEEHKPFRALPLIVFALAFKTF